LKIVDISHGITIARLDWIFTFEFDLVNNGIKCCLACSRI